MSEEALIERAIESAKCRIYRVRANVGESLAHQLKVDKQVDIMQVTIDALEKQIPKHLTNKQGNPLWGYCPSCKKAIDKSGSPVGCKHCLQRLDWSDEDDRD